MFKCWVSIKEGKWEFMKYKHANYVHVLCENDEVDFIKVKKNIDYEGLKEVCRDYMTKIKGV